MRYIFRRREQSINATFILKKLLENPQDKNKNVKSTNLNGKLKKRRPTNKIKTLLWPLQHFQINRFLSRVYIFVLLLDSHLSIVYLEKNWISEKVTHTYLHYSPNLKWDILKINPFLSERLAVLGWAGLAVSENCRGGANTGANLTSNSPAWGLPLETFSK